MASRYFGNVCTCVVTKEDFHNLHFWDLLTEKTGDDTDCYSFRRQVMIQTVTVSEDRWWYRVLQYQKTGDDTDCYSIRRQVMIQTYSIRRQVMIRTVTVSEDRWWYRLLQYQKTGDDTDCYNIRSAINTHFSNNYRRKRSNQQRTWEATLVANGVIYPASFGGGGWGVGRGVRGWSTGWEALLNRVLGEVVFTYLHRWQLCVRKSAICRTRW